MLGQCLEDRHHFVRHRLPASLWWIRIVDRYHPQTCKSCPCRAACQSAAGSEKCIRPAVGIDQHPTIVLPTLGRDVQNPYPAQSPFYDLHPKLLGESGRRFQSLGFIFRMNSPPALDIVGARPLCNFRRVGQTLKIIAPRRRYRLGNKRPKCHWFQLSQLLGKGRCQGRQKHHTGQNRFRDQTLTRFPRPYTVHEASGKHGSSSSIQRNQIKAISPLEYFRSPNQGSSQNQNLFYNTCSPSAINS